MKKVKVLFVGVLMMLSIASFVFKYETLKKEGPKQERVLEIKNERFELELYREKFISGIVLKGSASGPNLLQKSGTFEEVIMALFDTPFLDFEGEDKRKYRLELKSKVPLEEVRREVGTAIFEKLGYRTSMDSKRYELYEISISNFDQMATMLSQMDKGMVSFSDIKNGKGRYVGYSLEQMVNMMNENLGSNKFIATEMEKSERIGVEISNIEKLDSILSDLKKQGFEINEVVKIQEVLIISSE
ncbi:hypothetical protein MM236_04215 [Belliella sp. DSM 107340]|uniref:Uncharacterized protein n=1 Tax=Belliella calami TaxID=2923436 RepID=A0ABS9UKM5_9BACT|nr:hypothetical protein [Belliella calami]MCH7397177.1 hypothetical protein [Belliella calami]